MFHLILGTKAQYIKMVPIIHGLEEKRLPYSLIDTGQHAATAASIREVFELRPPDLFLSTRGRDIASFPSLAAWSGGVLAAGLIRGRALISRGDYCLVHGDTVSTLLGALLAKWHRASLIHVEAGERTHELLRPFPEEIVRRIVDRMADVGFASSESAFANLRKEKVRGRMINVGHNTILDTARLAGTLRGGGEISGDYALVSIHRAETVYSRRRMAVVAETVLKAARRMKVVWGLHDVTRAALERFRLLDRLENEERITLRGLFDYVSFMRAMRGAAFLVTDGGGPQEESFLLDTPCLLMRSETERTFHHNVLLSSFDAEKIDDFLETYERFRTGEEYRFESPSKKILDHLCGLSAPSGARSPGRP